MLLRLRSPKLRRGGQVGLLGTVRGQRVRDLRQRQPTQSVQPDELPASVHGSAGRLLRLPGLLQRGAERAPARRALVLERLGHDGRVVRPVLPGFDPDHAGRGRRVRPGVLLRVHSAGLGDRGELERLRRAVLGQPEGVLRREWAFERL